MFAGPNGSGKSSLKRKLEELGGDFGLWLNADEIARDLPGDEAIRVREAQRQVQEAREAALASRRDYSFETVMSHPSHIDHLRRARAAGYTVTLIYVALDNPLINLDQVRNRVADGGHDVPPDKIVSRYRDSLAQLADAIEVSHVARIFDNSDWLFGFRLLAYWNGGRLSTFVDPELTPDWFTTAARRLLQP